MLIRSIEINKQCARLIANAIIYYYNSAILSQLLIKYETSGKVETDVVGFPRKGSLHIQRLIFLLLEQTASINITDPAAAGVAEGDI